MENDKLNNINGFSLYANCFIRMFLLLFLEHHEVEEWKGDPEKLLRKFFSFFFSESVLKEFLF